MQENCNGDWGALSSPSSSRQQF